MRRIPVVFRGLARRNRQIFPIGAAQRLAQENDLSYVKTRVRK